MPLKDNIIKNWITTIIGTATMVITLILIWQKVMSFKWEGAIGLGIGCLLVVAPKSVEKITINTIKYVGGMGKGVSEEKPENPARPID